jgi:hypothetical protein
MNQGHLKVLICLFFIFGGFKVSKAQSADKIMIVIIDGARFTETLGDASHTYTPRMWGLSQLGTTINNFSNDNFTYTSRAIPALWCGAWTGVQSITYNGSATQHAILPTLWEYYRKDKSMPANECFYITQYMPSLWLPSFDADYGQNYWPAFHCIGSSDKDVATQTQIVMDNNHPHLMWVYLSGVDHAGHSGNWVDYTKAIFSADSIVGVLWDKIQSDDFYKNSTTLIVTNDHGRHDDQHGGFSGHACPCEGCRHIQFLAVGPTIKQNYVSSLYRTIPDLSVTASYLLGVNPTKSTGSVMQEIFVTNGIGENTNQSFKFNGTYPNPFSNSTTIRYFLNRPSEVRLSIYSISGEEIITLVNEKQGQGQKSIGWYGLGAHGQKVSPGVYFYNLQVGSQNESGKIVLLED